MVKEYTTIGIDKELHNSIKTYMNEKGIKSFNFLIGKMFEQYTRKR